MKAPIALLMVVASGVVHADQVPGSLDVKWDQGASDCTTQQGLPLQVHRYERRTYILRESPCAHFEAPFMYLLIGAERGLLIDTGAVADASLVPLGETVAELSRRDNGAQLPLTVVHSHSHLDHRRGDAQFESLPLVEIVGSDLDSVREHFGFDNWPNGVARLDLGERQVDVLPAPGHHPAHLVFFDHRTGLLVSGDMLYPGRLWIDDLEEYKLTVARLLDATRKLQVSHVVGGHIELDQSGRGFWPGARHHPGERPLELTREHLVTLGGALEDFNGFYSHEGEFVLVDLARLALALVSTVIVAIGLAGWAARRALLKRRVGQSD